MTNIKYTRLLIFALAITFRLHLGSSINTTTIKPKAPSLAKEKLLHRRVFVGEDIKVPCLTEKTKSMFSVGVNSTYAWSQGKDSNALGVRYAVQPNGDLYIKSLVASDAQILTCKILANNAETMEFKHQLSVVSVPDIEVGVILQYNGDKCIAAVKGMLKKKIQVSVEEPICQKGKVCKINKIIVACLKADVGVKYQITLKTGVRSKLNYTCTEDCPKPPEGPGPKQVRKSLHELFTKKVIEIPEHKLEFKTPKIHDIEETPSCIEGFILKSDICEPCAPGTYKLNIKECEKCPQHTYSEFYGATECQKCPKNEITVLNGRDSASYCIEFNAAAIIIIVFLSFIIFIVIPCCGPCAFLFYRYYKRTVAETGEEPEIVQNIRLFLSVVKGIIGGVTSKEVEQETPSVPEEQMPLLVEEHAQAVGGSTPAGGSPDVAAVSETAIPTPQTPTSSPLAATAVPLDPAPVISVQPTAGSQPV